MKITKRQLRRIIREQIEDEVQFFDYKEKIMQLFFDNANHGISTAKALPVGDVDQQFIDNMIELRDAGIAIVDSAKSAHTRLSSSFDDELSRADTLGRRWHEAFLNVTERSQFFSDDVEESIRELKDLFSKAGSQVRAYQHPHADTGPAIHEMMEWAGVS